MAVKTNMEGLAKTSILVVYCLIILYTAACSLKKPAWNWDMLPYMGVVLSYENPDVNHIHSMVYSIAKEQVPPVYYNRMVDSSNAYRHRMTQSPDAFHAQFPFYIVKPLYTGLVYLFYKAGIALPMATAWPSVISYCIIGLLLFHWLKKYWSDLYACAGGLLIMLSPPMLTVSALSSPDALSGLLIFSAVFFLTEKKALTAAWLFLLMAVFARLDNILPALLFLFVILFSKKWDAAISYGKMAWLFGGLFIAFFLISANVRSFGWNLLYYPAFAKQLNASYTANSAFDIGGYLSLVKTQWATGLYFSFVSFFFFLVLLLVWSSGPFNNNRFTIEQTLAVSFVVIMLLRFILQPLITDRIYIPYYLSLIVFLVKKQSLTVSHHQITIR